MSWRVFPREAGYVGGILSGLVLLLLVSGCARMAEPTVEHTESNAGNPKLHPRPWAKGMPAPLVALDRQSQVLYYQIKSKDWGRATQQLLLVIDTSRALQAKIGDENEFMPKLDNTLELLGGAIRRREQDMALTQANALTLLMADMSRRYKRPVPVEVSLLGYYGREMQALTPTQSVNQLAGKVLQTEEVWQRLRPTVLAKGGTAEAQYYDALMQTMGQAKTPQDFEKVGKDLIAHLNDLARLFTEPHR